ncbi:polysaccharide deacetylase family protein [Paucibacter sediminis]|uniref:Polysaccharide deacetylase family protein n=1 Tax=Paucibacter sediminis TaxID=3019553 RepID=A0AA95NFG6_9BURK|nr:polysaccharide deacetylase family protein [Paucibacter sp. S2-9]WIT11339.1 polysaccharide deacetylase family protein [Paucibacter sp. S2-9]
MLLKAAYSLLSPSGPRGRLTILTFHRVLPQRDPIFPGEVDAERFSAICSWLQGWAQVLPLDEAAERLQRGALPARACVLTFDDGYEDNCSVALPILQKHGLSATFFIATGFLGNGRMWNDRIIEAVRAAPTGTLDASELDAQRAELRFELSGAESRRQAIEALIAAVKYRPIEARLGAVARIEVLCGDSQPRPLMMADAGVRQLRSAGMQIGAHTVSHPILATLDEASARREIGDSKRYLEDLLREPVRLFAYPNGKPGQDYSAQSVEVVKSLGFDAAVSTAWGAARQGDSMFELPRFTPWDQSRLRYRARLVENLLRH